MLLDNTVDCLGLCVSIFDDRWLRFTLENNYKW